MRSEKRSYSSEINTVGKEIEDYVILESVDEAYLENEKQKETPEKEGIRMTEIFKAQGGRENEQTKKAENKTERKKAHRKYKLKLYLTWFVIFCIIIATWVLFIVPLCVSVYAISLSTFNVIQTSNLLSDNVTFLNTLSGSNSCPFNKTEAFARFHNYSTWFQSTYSNQSVSAINSSYGAMVRNTSCASRFVNNGTQCTPECLAYAPGGDGHLIAWRVFTTVGSFLSLVVSVLCIVTWIKIGGKLWDFPQIIFFYIICTVLVQSICILCGQIVPQRFFCKYRGLFDSRDDTTISCNMQGAIFHYSLMVFIYWYLFAVLNLLFIIASPFTGANNFQRYKRQIHVCESIFCWTFPLLALIVTLSVTKRYTFANFSAFCYPSDLFVIITLYLPGVVFCLFNGTAISIVIGIMLKRHYKLTKISVEGRSALAWVAQLAVFTVAFTITAWMVMLDFTVFRFNKPSYNAYLNQYSRCITIFGTFGSECCRPVYRDHINPALGILSSFFSSTWGVAGLSIIMSGGVKELWKKIITCNKCCHGKK